VSRLQIVNERGRVDRKLEPTLSDEKLVELYRSMVMARESDGRMLKLQRQGRIGTFPLCTGQEAASCGVALAMREQDWLVLAFREVGAMLMRGIPLEQVLALYAGYEEGNHNPQSPRTLPNSIPVGSQIPHATGLAYAARAMGETDTAVVAFFGDGATSEGDFHEGLNFAGVWRAPVVFVCQNNGWAISLPRSEQTASETIAQKAIAYGIEGIQVDGNDALAVYRATSEALERARNGGGPTLIEAVTYRLLMHTTSDDPTKYRNEQEVDTWWERDPIPRLQTYLRKRGIWNDDRERDLAAEVKAEVDAAVERFESRPPLKPDAPFDDVLSSTHDVIEEQRAEFLENLERGRDGEVDHG
jgi:pyruvate dehydrogenase E1 component alpha subunit